MQKTGVILGLLLVGILLFGCTALNTSNKFIGCWQASGSGGASYRVNLDSDGTGAYYGVTGEWKSVGENQIRFDASNGQSKYLTYYNATNITKEQLITEGTVMVYFFRCPTTS